MELNMKKIQYDSVEKKEYNVNVDAKELIGDSSKILSVTAYACCGRSEVINNEVFIEGVVNFIAVLKNQESIKKIERCERFSFTEKLNNEYSGAYIFSSAKAGKIRAFNEAGSLMLSCCVDITSILIIPNEINCVNDLEGNEFRKKIEPVSLYKNTLNNHFRFMISEKTELSPRVPEISELLSVNAYPEIKETHFSAGQLIIGGVLLVQTMYSSNDEYEPIVQVTDKFDFSQIIEMGEKAVIDPLVDLSVENISSSISVNEQGEMREITYSISMCGFAYAGECIECNLIDDVYSLNGKISCETKNISARSLNNKINTFLNKNINVRVPNGKPPISRPNSVTFIPKVSTCKIANSKAILNCRAEVSLIYTASGTGEIEGFNTFVDFELVVDNSALDKYNSAFSSIVLNEIQAFLVNEREMEVKVGLGIEIIPIKNQEFKIITDMIKENEVDFPEFGIVIYNVQKGDTLWSICKKYGVDKEDVLKLNHELTEFPEVGRKIYLFRRLVV